MGSFLSSGKAGSEIIEEILGEPWKFEFFKALALLDEFWSLDNELEVGISKNIKITPFKELGFPPSDLRAASKESDAGNLIHLQTSYLGLYGVDAPVPGYVVEQALRDDDIGRRTRDFLDIFNHLLYCQLYQSWKKSQLVIDGKGARQFDVILNSILSDTRTRQVNASSFGVKHSTGAGIAQLLRTELDTSELQLFHTQPHWIKVNEPSLIGNDKTMKIGCSLVLGDRVRTTAGMVKILIGPLDLERAKKLVPGQPGGNRLTTILATLFSGDIDWQCEVLVNKKCQKPLTLGSDRIQIGDNCFVGESSAGIIRKSFSRRHYANALLRSNKKSQYVQDI